MPLPVDRNLLFAGLALRAGYITPARFAAAIALALAHPEAPIEPILAERGWLSATELATIDQGLRQELLDLEARIASAARSGTSPEVTGDAPASRSSLDATSDAPPSLPTPPPVGHVLLTSIGASEDDIERYTITRLHATGGIGRVWLARDVSLGREVALKDLRPERAANPAVWGRFLREAQITGRLEHPGIVPIYELGRRPEDGQPFYTMRFVRGRTLREALAAYHQKRQRGGRDRLDLRDLLTAFVGVCNAVAYAHSKGVIHRDLKPANVVLGEFGEVMVLDWGLAKETRPAEQAAAEPSAPSATEVTTEAAGTGSPPPAAASNVNETTDLSAPSPDDAASATLEGQVLGTPAYMAPEQADGRLADIDARTDVYGLGAILYEILTGRSPFQGGSMQEVLTRVRSAALVRPRDQVPDTPRALEAVCLKALAKQPADRYGNAPYLAADVSRFMADEPTSAYREPVVARAWRWARRHRSLVSTVVATLAVAVPILVVGIVLVTESEERERAARKQEQEARERAQLNYLRTLHAADALTEEVARGVRPIAGTQAQTVIDILERARRISDELLTVRDMANTRNRLSRSLLARVREEKKFQPWAAAAAGFAVQSPHRLAAEASLNEARA